MEQSPDELAPVLHALSGGVRFRGALTHGPPVSDFLESFPDVTEEQANAIVAWEQQQTREVFGLQPA